MSPRFFLPFFTSLPNQDPLAPYVPITTHPTRSSIMYKAPEGTITPCGPVTALAEVSGLRQQIFGNAVVLFPDCAHVEICMVSAEYPESGYYGARLVDPSVRNLLIGRQWARTVPEALAQLLQETCDAIRDSYVLQNYQARYPDLASQ
ncbi:hypothetical protein D6D26_07018 [Aureobasidium pullulans]|nr:hypothetical protein D6D26_07018 [Aureobasidium pullulans]